jgi:hypothetical protein
MRACTKTQVILLVAAGILLTIALLIFILGYAVPIVQLDGYQAKFCFCSGTNITDSGSPYYGYANLEYGTLTKSVLIVGSKSRTVVYSYLAANYRNGSYVPCYVSADDIEVALFANVIALVLGSITLLFGVLFLAAFVVFTIRSRRRLQYEELQDAKHVHFSPHTTTGMPPKIVRPSQQIPSQEEIVLDLPSPHGTKSHVSISLDD